MRIKKQYTTDRVPIPNWSVKKFKAYVRSSMQNAPENNAASIVMQCFSVANVIKPEHVITRRFEWLYEIAKAEIQLYKTTTLQ